MPLNMMILKLRDDLKKAWSRETSSDPDSWTPENPAWGQCAVTACAVQDKLGGNIIWAMARLPDGRELSHYFNDIGGHELDMTREQFPAKTYIPPGMSKKKEFKTTRDYILSFPQTAARYEKLKSNMKASLS